MRASWGALGAGALCFTAAPAHALELGAQTLATLVSDDQTKGLGVGLGVETSHVLWRPASAPSAVLLRGRLSLLGGAGLMWGLEAGGAWRSEMHSLWQPEVGAYLLYLGGDLARSIDSHGELAANPIAALLGVSPGRLALEHGWVSLLSIRGGVTLGRAGQPPVALSVTLFEVGQDF